MQETLIKFKMEKEKREEEIKDLQKQTRASKTMGFHEIQKIKEQVDKKQKEYFKAQKKYFQAQEQQFLNKDKKSEELNNKLQLTFEVKRLANVALIIED